MNRIEKEYDILLPLKTWNKGTRIFLARISFQVKAWELFLMTPEGQRQTKRYANPLKEKRHQSPINLDRLHFYQSSQIRLNQGTIDNLKIFSFPAIIQ